MDAEEGPENVEAVNKRSTLGTNLRKCLHFDFTVNRYLLPLKATLAVYYAAMTSLLPYLTIHMKDIGISIEEISTIYAVLPFTAFVAPLFTGVLADKLGNYRRVLMLMLFLSGCFYSSLLLVPRLHTTAQDVPILNASLNEDGIRFTYNTCPISESCALKEVNDLVNITLRCTETCHNYRQVGFHLCFHTENTTNCLNYAANTNATLSATLNRILETNLTNNLCMVSPVGPIKHMGTDYINVTGVADCSSNCVVGNALTVPCVYTQGNRRNTFWIYFVLRLLATMTIGSCFSLLNATVLTMIRRENAKLGRQGFWGMVSGSIASPVNGIIIDYISKQKGYTDYSSAFFISDALLLITMILVAILHLEIDLPSKKMAKDFIQLIKRPEVDVFLFLLFILGTMWGFIESYLFIYLKELKAPTYLLGLTVTTGGVLGLLVIHWADSIADKVGRMNMCILAALVYYVRCVGYSYIWDPWLCFPFEAMEVFTQHLLMVALTTWVGIMAPKGMLATLSATIEAVHYDIGKGSGSFIGGNMYAAYGGRQCFRIMGTIAAVAGIATFILYHAWIKRYVQQQHTATRVSDGNIDVQHKENGDDVTQQDRLLEMRENPTQ